MPTKRKGAGPKSKPPKVQLDPEAEKELLKEIDFCICHFEQLRDHATKEEQHKKYEKVLKTLGTFFKLFFVWPIYELANHKNLTKTVFFYAKSEYLESYTTPLVKKKALIRQELPKYKELMAEFDKDWDKETAKTGQFTEKKQSEVTSVSYKRRSGETGKLAAKMEKITVSEDFKWKPTSDSFSFNFAV